MGGEGHTPPAASMPEPGPDKLVARPAVIIKTSMEYAVEALITKLFEDHFGPEPRKGDRLALTEPDEGAFKDQILWAYLRSHFINTGMIRRRIFNTEWDIDIEMIDGAIHFTLLSTKPQRLF